MADTAFAPLPRLVRRPRGRREAPKTRRTGRAKVTGTATFTAEWDGRHGRTDDLPGLLHAVAVPATDRQGHGHRHRLRSAALAMPGVRHVLTPENSPEPDQSPPGARRGCRFRASTRPGPRRRRSCTPGSTSPPSIADTFTAARDGALAVRVSYESAGDAT